VINKYQDSNNNIEVLYLKNQTLFERTKFKSDDDTPHSSITRADLIEILIEAIAESEYCTE
jgi:hypothetical protein